MARFVYRTALWRKHVYARGPLFTWFREGDRTLWTSFSTPTWCKRRRRGKALRYIPVPQEGVTSASNYRPRSLSFMPVSQSSIRRLFGWIDRSNEHPSLLTDRTSMACFIYIYIYIYMYVCVCVCVYVSLRLLRFKMEENWLNTQFSIYLWANR